VRKFLICLGALTSIVIVAAAVGLGALYFEARALDTGSKDFADTAVRAIAANWSKEELLTRATPELRKSVTSGQLNSAFHTFSQVGSLLEYEGSEGQWNMSYVSGADSIVFASYVAKARFRNGDATFRIFLTRRDGRWLIQGFQVKTKPNVVAAEGA
jgi:hypothetical protein